MSSDIESAVILPASTAFVLRGILGHAATAISGEISSGGGVCGPIAMTSERGLLVPDVLWSVDELSVSVSNNKGSEGGVGGLVI